MKIKSTQEKKYADYLINAQDKGWKNKIDVQRPYRIKLQKLSLGKTLDIGCGIGRNLKALSSKSVGVDHNKFMIQYLNKAGYTAYTVSDFEKSKSSVVGSFDSLLFAHIIEHLSIDESKKMIRSYLKYLKLGGRVVVICPQKKGFSKDSTHVEFHTRDTISKLLSSIDLEVVKEHSFPLPELFGSIFAPNEYWVVAKKIK